MPLSRTRRNTGLFIALLLLGGLLGMLTRAPYGWVATMAFDLQYLTYAGLLLFWAQSLRARLLPTPARTYLIWAAFLMLFYLMARAFKYRMILTAAAPLRYATYTYLPPMALVPALFLMTCLRISRCGARGAWDERLLLIPALIMSVLALTNDLHGLVYVPRVDMSTFTIDYDSYRQGPGLYAIYAWMAVSALWGVRLLLRASRRRPGRSLMKLAGVIALWIALGMIEYLVFEKHGTVRPFHLPEINIFGMLAVIEVCIRARLIPGNENYDAFFARLGLLVLITDRDFEPVYVTDVPLPMDEGLMRGALAGPVYPNENLRLTGMPIQGGLAFWAEDEAELHRENRRLAEANALLDQENELIAAENALEARRAQLTAQAQVYDRIARALYPRQKRIEALLLDAQPDTDTARRALGLCCVLNAWSKRKSNLMLLSDRTLPRHNRELFLALQESARYLKYCGVEAAAVGEEYAEWPLSTIHALYDAFEDVVEAYIPHMKRMTASLMADGVRLAIEADADPALPEGPCAVRRQRDEGYTFLTIRAGREDTAP